MPPIILWPWTAFCIFGIIFEYGFVALFKFFILLFGFYWSINLFVFGASIMRLSKEEYEELRMASRTNEAWKSFWRNR